MSYVDADLVPLFAEELSIYCNAGYFAKDVDGKLWELGEFGVVSREYVKVDLDSRRVVYDEEDDIMAFEYDFEPLHPCEQLFILGEWREVFL